MKRKSSDLVITISFIALTLFFDIVYSVFGMLYFIQNIGNPNVRYLLVILSYLAVVGIPLRLLGRKLRKSKKWEPITKGKKKRFESIIIIFLVWFVLSYFNIARIIPEGFLPRFILYILLTIFVIWNHQKSIKVKKKNNNNGD